MSRRHGPQRLVSGPALADAKAGPGQTAEAVFLVSRSLARLTGALSNPFTSSGIGQFRPIPANWAIIHHNFTKLGGCFTPNSFAYLYNDLLGVCGVDRPSTTPAASKTLEGLCIGQMTERRTTGTKTPAALPQPYRVTQELSLIHI